jgi:hypothetical protein
MTKQTKFFWASVVANVGWIAFMRPYTPKNIVQFEFAKTIEGANNIISNWGSEGVELSKTSIYLDFIFIVLYCTAIMLGCKVASDYSGKAILIKIGFTLSWLIWLAGLCDIVENFAMLETLKEINQSTISIAFYSAAIKFGIVAMTLLFILTSAFTRLINKKNPKQSTIPKK